MRHPRRPRALPLLLLLACGAAGGRDARPPARERPTVLPGGVADAAGRTGFLANPGGGIDAVDLTTGDLLWQTHQAQRPLLVFGDRLLARATGRGNRLRVLAFERTGGECLMRSDPVVFPDWVVAGEGPGHSFAARWYVEGRRLVLQWEASARGPRQSPAAGRHAAGLARIDLDTGRVEAGPAPEPAPPERFHAPLEKLAVRWQGVAGKEFRALVLEEDAAGQRLVLRSWDRDTGAAGPPRLLLAGKRLLVQPTLDGRYLCLRDAAGRPDEDGPAGDRSKYSWSVFAVQTGQRVGGMFCEPGTQAVAVLGSRAYCLMAGPIRARAHRPSAQARTLRAIDLRTGNKLWERPVEGKVLTPPS